MNNTDATIVYRYRRTIYRTRSCGTLLERSLQKQWCPCVILENISPTESHVLVYIERNGGRCYRYITVDVRDLCVAKNQDCFPNLERALMACKIKYDFITPDGALFGADLKESEYWDLFDGYITGKYKTLYDVETARNEFLVPGYQYKFYF